MSSESTLPTPPSDPRHHRFAVLVLQCRNRTEAYLGAGFECSRESAAVGGSRLMKNPEVDAFISQSLAIEMDQRQARAAAAYRR